MADSETSQAELPGEAHHGFDLSETVLRSEIAFWKEMIGTRCEALPPDAVERMHYALALAEKRLTGLFQNYPNPDAPNVYQLDTERRKVK